MLGLLSWLAIFPICFLVLLGFLVAKRYYRSALVGLAFAVVAAVVMIWGINQSRSSTAGIGYLALPFGASLVGVLGAAFAQWSRASDNATKLAGWTALGIALLLVGITARQGQETRQRNAMRDTKQEEFSNEVARDRETITAELQKRPGGERTYLDSSIRARINDRAFLLAALQHDSISPSLLDTLARSNDMGITLEALRNKGTGAATLERVYRTASYPDYYFQALASHPNTPQPVLRELYVKPRTISGLEVWLAGNPSTPKDVLRGIAASTREAAVIAQLIENPSSDCATLSKVANTLMKQMKRDADDPNVFRLSQRVPEVCSSARDSAAKS